MGLWPCWRLCIRGGEGGYRGRAGEVRGLGI